MATLRGTAWMPRYIGKALSLRDRLCNHEQWDDAVRLGATHILAKVLHDERERDRVERLMIEECNPPLNVQHRTMPVASLGMIGLLNAPSRATGGIRGMTAASGPGIRATPSDEVRLGASSNALVRALQGRK